jgi:hypothetical protein
MAHDLVVSFRDLDLRHQIREVSKIKFHEPTRCHKRAASGSEERP